MLREYEMDTKGEKVPTTEGFDGNGRDPGGSFG